MIGDANGWWRNYRIELFLLLLLWADQESGDDVAYAAGDGQEAEQPDDPHHRIDYKRNLFDDVWRQLQDKRG